MLEQHPHAIPQVLTNAPRPRPQIDLAHALPPRNRIAKPPPRITPSFFARHPLRYIQPFAHGYVKLKLFPVILRKPLSPEQRKPSPHPAPYLPH
jgi:hypothetical protein